MHESDRVTDYQLYSFFAGWTEAGHHAYGTDEEYLRRLDEWWSSGRED